MDTNKNVFLQGTSIPRTSPYATASVFFAALTLVAIIGSAVINRAGYPTAARYLAYLQLAFPIAIVCGHIALRQIRATPHRVTGRTIALLGLYVGYFNLVMVFLVLFRIF